MAKDAPKEGVEKLIIQAGGLKYLISCLHGSSAIHKVKEEGSRCTKTLNKEKKEEAAFHVPDGLPKSAKEVEEEKEEKARMPDSALTRMLRSDGKLPAWYSSAPCHYTG
ncbi:CCG-binding protein 1-like [Diospyros lotus]|uniref:CCG-binding protein 1-like n=1 Tax=Diospyros lotus TaxID=55363 RepID=UPI002253BABA|nr:CCG-binding protein 1-like [Diospyros lotus]